MQYLTRVCSQWGAIANPHAKIFDSPSTPQSHPGAWPWQQNENSVQYVFFLFYICENTHKVWYKNLWNWHVNDIWPHPKVTSLTLRWKFYLHSVLLVIPVDLIYYMTMFEIFFLTPLGTPSAPKFHPWGMTQGTEWKSRLISFVSFIFENTHKVWYKNLWNWLCN